MKIRIKNDLYDIASRLKEIDRRYEVYFETELQKFTLWGLGKRQVIFPYESLDQRAIEYTLKTRVENAEELVREIDLKNERYQNGRVIRVQDKIEDEFSRRLRLAKI